MIPKIQKHLKNKKGGFLAFDFMILTLFLMVLTIGVMPIFVSHLNKSLVEASENVETEKQNDNSSQPIKNDSTNFYILDKAGLLSVYSANRMSEKSKQLDLSSKAQIVVETLTSINGQNIEEYSSSRFRELGLGDKKLNNGVLIVVAPLEKVARVEVGYGLEGAISDGELGRIVREKGLKRFEEQNFEKGIIDTYFAIADEVEKEYKPSGRKGSEGGAGVTVKWN